MLLFFSDGTGWVLFLLLAAVLALLIFWKRKELNEIFFGKKNEDEKISSSNENNSEEQLQQEKNMLLGMIKFNHTNVKQVMRSKMDITAVNTEMSFEEMIQVVKESGYSRLPVYEESADKVKGILYTKDLLDYLNEENPEHWQNLIRPAFYTHEGKMISELLIEFQTRRVHLAIVIDEYGTTVGLITLEDLVEEIIGDIRDETDEKTELEFWRIDENSFVFEGKTLLNDVCRALKIAPHTFDELKGDTDTLAGLVLELLGKMPHYKEQVTTGDFTFTVLKMDNQRIRRIKVEKKNV